MSPTVRAVGWSLLGGLLGWALTAIGIFAYDRVFESAAGDDIRAWQTYGAVTGGVAGAVVGLALGAAYGVARGRAAGDGPR